MITLISPDQIKDFDLSIEKSYDFISINDREVIEDSKIVRWHTSNPLSKDQFDQIRKDHQIDIFQTDDRSNIKLFLADMDSTIVKGETLDDMADMIGIGDQISAITARAMRGELDFEDALTERIALLKGQPASLIDRALEEMTLNPGAQQLLTYLKSRGVYCVLISGGFTQFTGQVAKQLGFDAHFGNELVIDNDEFTGQVQYPILDKNFKLLKLQELQNSMDLNPHQIMAVGDGANDLPMLQTAGIGIAYHGKPLLQDTIINQVNYGDLTTLMHLI